jgi:iron complex outermembrane receptor protein
MFSVPTLSLLLAGLMAVTPIQSQTPLKDTLEISGIEVIGQIAITDFPEEGLHIELEEGGNLSDLISRKTNINIKSYGPGGVSTLRYRGAPPSHSVIRWNGLALNSPFLGQADLSQLPLALGSTLHIRDAGGLDGGGGASLQIQSENLPGKENQLSLHLAGGSFGTKALRTKLILANRKTGYALLPYFTSSENRFPFPYTDRSGTEVTRYRDFAAYDSRGLVQQISRMIQRNQVLSIHSWIQSTERDLPPPSGRTVLKRNESLTESTGAHLLRYQYHQNKSHFEASLGYQKQSYHYHFHPADAHTRTDFSGISQLIRASYAMTKRLQGKTEWEGKWQEVISDNYDQGVRRTEGTLYQQLVLSLSDIFLLEPEVAVAWQERKEARYIPGMRLRFQPLAKPQEYFLSARAIASTPSLNDLYWYPGGNPALDAELGSKYSLGHIRKLAGKGLSLEVEGNAFYQHIRNWIVWQPGVQSHIWTPVNLKEVLSYGIDLQFSVLRKGPIGKWNIRGGYGWNRVRERNADGLLELRQIIYTPQHSASLNANYRWKQWGVENSWQYTGLRYSGLGAGQELPAHLIAELGLTCHTRIRKQDIRLRAEVHNLMNIQYESVAGYPMPGRSFNIHLIIKIQNHKSNENNETP